MLMDATYWKSCFEKSEDEKRELLVRLYRERGQKMEARGAEGVTQAMEAVALDKPCETGNEPKCANCKVLSKTVATLQENLKKVEAENVSLRSSYGFVESELSRLANALYTCEQNFQNSNEETKVLKEQVTVFREDFHKERQDREKAQGDMQELKDKLKDMEDLISVLTHQIEFHREDYTLEKAKNQKLTADLELRRQLEQNVQPQVQLVYSIPQSESAFSMPTRRATINSYDLSHQQAVTQRRRALVRSKTLPEPPRSFFHGGDVVVDSNSH